MRFRNAPHKSLKPRLLARLVLALTLVLGQGLAGENRASANFSVPDTRIGEQTAYNQLSYQEIFASDAKFASEISVSGNGYMPSGVLPGGASTSASGRGATLASVSSGISINAASGGIPTGLNRDSTDANIAAIDTFNLGKTQAQLQTQQVGAELFGQVANTEVGNLIAAQEKANPHDPNWAENGTYALILHGLIGVAQGAIAGGGSAGAMAAGGAGGP